MAIKLKDVLAKLPDDERAEVEASMARAVAEEASLRQLREARRKSQTEVAERLHTTQAAISRLEKRADVYLSTLRKYVEAMGGSLEIVATFPDRPAVKLTQFHD